MLKLQEIKRWVLKKKQKERWKGVKKVPWTKQKTWKEGN
jgi:hypothetical protein